MPPTRDPADRYDAVIIGAGHNGLVCACYLAAAGLRVKVLDRRDVVGGAAVTAEFHPGFRNSVAAYTVSLLHPAVIRDLHLAEHGLRIVARPLANFLPLDERRSLRIGPTLADTQAEVARFSAADAERLPAFHGMLERAADVLRDLLLETPPNVGGGVFEFVRALGAGNRVRRLPMAGRRDLLDLFTKSAGDLLDRWFESEPIKAALGFDAIVGNYASPYAGGSAYVLLHHVFGEVNGIKGTWGHALGGMGAITQAMAREAQRLGVDVSLTTPVTRVITRAGRAEGVVTREGEEIRARCVVSGVNPRVLYLEMLAEQDLDPDFVSRIRAWKCASGTFRMNVALSALPDFTCAPGTAVAPHHQSGIVMAPSLAYMERAWIDARAAGMSSEPVVEMLIPSTVDDSLAPPGSHVASLFCQQFSPQLPDGLSWDAAREAAIDRVFGVVERHAPNFRRSVIAHSSLTPLDIERQFGMVGGDIFHGALSLDQLYSARPVLGHGDYRGPLRGLYMCGSGTHPGGGVTGVPGHNCAREVLRDVRRRRV